MKIVKYLKNYNKNTNLKIEIRKIYRFFVNISFTFKYYFKHN